jgi:hypothetical protein
MEWSDFQGFRQPIFWGGDGQLSRRGRSIYRQHAVSRGDTGVFRECAVSRSAACARRQCAVSGSKAGTGGQCAVSRREACVQGFKLSWVGCARHTSMATQGHPYAAYGEGES